MSGTRCSKFVKAIVCANIIRIFDISTSFKPSFVCEPPTVIISCNQAADEIKVNKKNSKNKMFYVVYLIESKRNVILPVHWVDGNQNQLEKFINYGVNNNQKHRCYFNNNRNLFDIQPNFDDFPVGNSHFPDEGCYIGKIVKFKRMYFHYLSTYQHICSISYYFINLFSYTHHRRLQ